ncbi:MAG TPA: hypothetical protein DEF88_00620 [Porphyromonadaceae bacterium]|jgi:hypothetical protein|nr:hypothetical protein [Porphyromonadaceae bacterium]HBX18935.1 hypothetical protein [Porphyromonadaceae bacterium]HCM21106.1 hypothetical protein [Porphyromonadaceae bacterium]
MKTKRLLVEGNDDKHVMLALCENFQITESFDIIDCKGITDLQARIPIDFKTSGAQTVGIIVDADINIDERWTVLKKILHNVGFDMPKDIPENGLILQNPSHQKVGVWIMPNNKVPGMLEDFISFLVPRDDKLMPIVEKTLIGIESENLNKYKIIHRAKASVHTWLAWQEDPGTPLGLSITKRYLTTEEETCKRLTDWIRKLFS